MSRLFFIRFRAVFVAAAFVLATPIVGFAGEKTSDRSPDGRFAMSFEDGKDGEVRITLVETKVHELPDFPECDNPGMAGYINSNLTPKSWVKPDTLVLIAHDEWTTDDNKAHECNRTVTIAIDSSGKASIQSVQEKKK